MKLLTKLIWILCFIIIQSQALHYEKKTDFQGNDNDGMYELDSIYGKLITNN